MTNDMDTMRRLSRVARASMLALGALALAACGDFDDGPQRPLPAPESIAPAMGPTTGGQLVAIQGHGFTEGSAVLFDGVPATDVRVESEAVITCHAPAHAEVGR